MSENPRSRDLIILSRGRSITPTLSSSMSTAGWVGGTGVRWAGSTKDDFEVELSDGEVAGFMIWGSNESADQFTSMTMNQPTYRAGTMAFGRWLIMTVAFERYTYASRTGGGPLVPLTYTASDHLRFSLRGLWTVEDEWALSGDIRAPNENIVGFVSQSPTGVTSNYITIQTSF
jgi:hypothetical protein